MMESSERQTTPVPAVDFLSFDSEMQTPPQSAQHKRKYREDDRIVNISKGIGQQAVTELSCEVSSSEIKNEVSSQDFLSKHAANAARLAETFGMKVDDSQRSSI